MNIEHIRQIARLEPGKFVLHIGEENVKFWLDSYQASNFQKVFWTSPSFYTRAYNTAALERATVESYTKPWYYFVKCKVRGDGLLTEGIDDSYSSDLEFRMAFANEDIKAIVIDETPHKKDEIAKFFKNAQNALNLCRPEIIYVRAGFENVVEEYAQKHGLAPSFSFDVGIVRTLNQTGTVICSYTAFLKDKK